MVSKCGYFAMLPKGYAGKLQGEQPEKNFFASHQLGQLLLQRKITMVRFEKISTSYQLEYEFGYTKDIVIHTKEK